MPRVALSCHCPDYKMVLFPWPNFYANQVCVDVLRPLNQTPQPQQYDYRPDVDVHSCNRKLIVSFTMFVEWNNINSSQFTQLHDFKYSIQHTVEKNNNYWAGINCLDTNVSFKLAGTVLSTKFALSTTSTSIKRICSALAFIKKD